MDCSSAILQFNHNLYRTKRSRLFEAKISSNNSGSALVNCLCVIVVVDRCCVFLLFTFESCVSKYLCGRAVNLVDGLHLTAAFNFSYFSHISLSRPLMSYSHYLILNLSLRSSFRLPRSRSLFLFLSFSVNLSPPAGRCLTHQTHTHSHAQLQIHPSLGTK